MHFMSWNSESIKKVIAGVNEAPASADAEGGACDAQARWCSQTAASFHLLRAAARANLILYSPKSFRPFGPGGQCLRSQSAG
jgi:hypothetical protein